MRTVCGIIAAAMCCVATFVRAEDIVGFVVGDSPATRIAIYGDNIADAGKYFDWMVSDKAVIGYGEIATDQVPELGDDEIGEWVKEYLAENYAENHNLSQSNYANAFTEKFGTDIGAAFTAETGKIAADGTKLCVYHDYIAGTDPLDVTSRFTVKIEMADGKPHVIPDPNLGAARKYTVKGKEKLDDAEWADVAENHRFFKVTVEMP